MAKRYKVFIYMFPMLCEEQNIFGSGTFKLMGVLEEFLETLQHA